MTANFGAGEISGEMTNFNRQDPDGIAEDIPGTMAMQTAAFDVNGFSGNLAPDAAFTDTTNVTITSGTYSGAFYGPEANEVAGVLTLTGSGDNDFNGIGYFRGFDN
jgi:hypothetical protein